jgi:small subunit ribosomal protein S8
MSQLSDPIGDFLTRLRNSVRANQNETTVPYSKIKASIAHILKQEGYIQDYTVDTGEGFPKIRVQNRYSSKQSPALTGVKRVSRPGLRKYVGVDEIPRVLGGLGTAILSTPQGIVSGKEAKRKNVGGEILAVVW